MNVAQEMNMMLSRFEELIRYAQEKIDRASDRKETIGAQVAREKADAAQKVIDEQTAEAEENLKDQKESFDLRNKILEKSQPEEDDVPMTATEVIENRKAASKDDNAG